MLRAATLSVTITLLMLFPIYSAYASDGPVGRVTPPKLLDTQGNEVSSASAGQLVFISTQFATDDRTPYVLFIEARDETGITVFSEFAIGQIEPLGQTTIGLSWSPDEPGEYILRSFALATLNNVAPLTAISERAVTVSS